jgi:hypothetical protein
MSGVEIDSTEYVPVERWRRLGRIDAIRRRVRRIAIGAGVVFLGLTLAPPGEGESLLFGAIRLLSLVTGISAWSVSEALDGATDDDGDGSVLAAVGVLVLVALAWGADRSRTGALLWRVLLGEVAASTTGADAGDAGGPGVASDGDATGSAPVTADDGEAGSRPRGSSLGILAVLLGGGAVALTYLPRAGAGGVGFGQVGVFLLLMGVVGGVVGLLAALSLG